MSNPQKRFSVGGFHIPYKLSEIQDTPEVLAAIDKLEIGESWDDGNGSEKVTRLADAEYTPDGVTITITTEQLATIIHALGIASDEFAKLATTCHALGNTRHTWDPGLRDAGNAYTQRACDLVDLMQVLREGAKS